MVHRVSVPIHSREAAILDAMPAMVALLDSEGGILSVNEAWRRFADENALPHPTHCIGLNYLEVCDHAQGDDSSEAQRVAKGIRSVIGKRLKQYSIEYPCHSPMVQRWFLMTATPLAEGSSENIVVMHLNITERKLAEQAVRESRQRLDGIINSAMDAIVTVDEHQRVVLANPAAERIFGYTLIDMMGESVEQIIPERFCLEHSQSRVAFLKKGHGSHSIGTLQVINGRRKSGDMFPIEATLSSATIGGQRLYTAIVRDVTELTRSEQQIRRLNRVHQVLTAINNLIVHVHDRAELFKGACKIAIEAGGFRMALIGIADPLTKQVTIAASAGIEPQSLNDLQGLMSSRERASSMMIVRALEQKKPLFSNDAQHDTGVSFTSVHEAMGIRSMAAFPLIVAEEAVGVIALFASEVDRFQGEEMQLLTELSGDVAFAIGYLEKQDKLDYLAYYDVLTGLANRRLFLERVSQFMRADDGSRHMLALGVIDLVRFKSINDSSGRPAGDMILRQVAEWLTVHLSSSSMLARVEGDRFAVVIPDVIRIGEVGQLMEKTLNALANHPFRINTGVFRITGYAGVAMFPQDGLDAETLIYSAEAALNRAKASGKACLFYTREITERAVGKLSLENQLRRALENEEFVLHYQAKKNVATGKLVGAEALLRWVDPQSGLVPPGRFVPMLEETGLIHEVGSWVLRTAVKIICAGMRRGWMNSVLQSMSPRSNCAITHSLRRSERSSVQIRLPRQDWRWR
jgi:diguanylate cyclase (GGDEF)-like protein/PAS domain S-box-containing protein